MNDNTRGMWGPPAPSPYPPSAPAPGPYQAAPYGAGSPPAPTGPARRGRLAGPLLAASALTMGLMAGLFFAFDVSVMPGLARSDAATYVQAMQNFNAVIDGSGLFGLIFVGALLTAGVAAFYEYRQGRRSVAGWVIAATACYVVVLILTVGVNIPLNNQLARVDNADKTHALSIISDFKGTWETANIARTLLCTAALGLLTRALVLYGRATSYVARNI
ncbi:hypothetical protein GCM10010361_40860 [Streptomyces olivaceiscleroticus]|uniref:DUF1772 domain-containing protein n=2 Tax=Streptomyces olivaceiscleroticus TaxID=68245 RepID=A0ABN1ABP4_9ACTN